MMFGTDKPAKKDKYGGLEQIEDQSENSESLDSKGSSIEPGSGSVSSSLNSEEKASKAKRRSTVKQSQEVQLKTDESTQFDNLISDTLGTKLTTGTKPDLKPALESKLKGLIKNYSQILNFK